VNEFFNELFSTILGPILVLTVVLGSMIALILAALGLKPRRKRNRDGWPRNSN
jgi:hypothetical protein